MSVRLKAAANKVFPGRKSAGPLYTQRELTKAEVFLGLDGYRHVEDIPALGLRIYGREKNVTVANMRIDLRDDVQIYLDEIKPTPQSGEMVFARSVKMPDGWKGVGGFESDFIWDFVACRDREMGLSLPQRLFESIRRYGQFLTFK
jgi:hypothetical protein